MTSRVYVGCCATSVGESREVCLPLCNLGSTRPRYTTRMNAETAPQRGNDTWREGPRDPSEACTQRNEAGLVGVDFNL